MRETVEFRVAEEFAPLAEELRSPDGDRHDAAERVERAEIEVRRARREQAPSPSRRGGEERW
jgi:hypothetical protein